MQYELSEECDISRFQEKKLMYFIYFIVQSQIALDKDHFNAFFQLHKPYLPRYHITSKKIQAFFAVKISVIHDGFDFLIHLR